MRQRPNFRSQRGTAIFMALFFVVLVTSLSITWYLQSRVAVKRTLLTLTADQAYSASQGMLYFELALLKNTLHKSQTGEATSWPILIPEKISPEGTVSYGRIEDYQARLNINNLTDANTKAAFIRLLTALDPATNQDSAAQLAAAVVAWITPSNLLTPLMKEMNQSYASYNPAYRAANRPVHIISELRLVKGVSASIFTALEPYVCALPPKTAINLKHSSAAVVLAYNLPPQNAPSVVMSEFFLVRTDIVLKNQHLVLSTLVHIDPENKENKIDIVWQSRGPV